MNSDKRIEALKCRIASFEDFPKKGVTFRDIFPLFLQPSLLSDVIDLFIENIMQHYPDTKLDAIIGLDARGFLFGPLLACRLSVSFVPLRKKGKLPGKVFSQSYLLEYGESTIEMQDGVVKPGSKVVVVDDLLATGGTMLAACQLLKKQNCNIIACQCLIELAGLKGAEKLPQDVPFYSILQY